MLIDLEIQDLRAQLRTLSDVRHLYLFNRKGTVHGNLASFKLCAVIETQDKLDLERRIYREIDSPVPFDIVIYTPAEWETLSKEPGTFAHKVAQGGCDLLD